MFELQGLPVVGLLEQQRPKLRLYNANTLTEYQLSKGFDLVNEKAVVYALIYSPKHKQFIISDSNKFLTFIEMKTYHVAARFQVLEPQY